MNHSVANQRSMGYPSESESESELIIKQQKNSGPSDQLIATWNNIHFWTSTRLKMSKIFQIKIIDLFDLNIFHLQSEYLHLRYIFISEFSHECATIIKSCETPNYFENQDFKRSVYCWAHWKRDASNAWRVILCFFEFYIIWNPAHGVDRHVHIILLKLKFLLLLLELNFQQKYFPFISLSVLCKELYKTEKNADIIKCCIVKFKLFDSSNRRYWMRAGGKLCTKCFRLNIFPHL